MRKSIQLLIICIPICLLAGFGILEEHPFTTSLKAKLQAYQTAFEEEKLYLHVDRPFYTLGEDIWFKAYLTDRTHHQFSQLSEILHVELLTPKGSVYKKLILPVKYGIAHGDFHLAEDSPGGIYTLVAYTSWMKNGGKDTYFKKKIQVQKIILPRLENGFSRKSLWCR